MSVLRRILGSSAEGGAVPAAAARNAARDNIATDSGGMASIADSASASFDAGHLGPALGRIDTALTASPGDPELLLARSSILSAWGRFHEARTAALQAATSGPPDARLLLQIGWSCFGIGSLQEAEVAMRKALDAEPGAWKALAGLATVLHAQGRLAEALDAFRSALELNPVDEECLINTGVCELALGRLANAEAVFRQAARLHQDSANALSNLGAVLGRLDRRDEAIEVLRRAERLDAGNLNGVDAYVNLAQCLEDSNRNAEGIGVLEKHLAERPNADAQVIYAHLLLRAGRLREGWEAYEFRWVREPLRSRRLPPLRPAWNGQDLRGKVILLRAEQGLGDAIQFARYAPMVKALGATVFLAVLPGLEALLANCPGVDRMLGPGEPCPEFDYYANLMSLPRVFGTDLQSIPGATSLQVDGARIEHWRSRLAGGGAAALKVGLAWRGNPDHARDRYRSIPLPAFSALAPIAGVRYFSLQKGARPGETSTPAFEFTDLAPELDDLCDTAALLMQLDILICADTAVAHLAGSLGTETWLLLPNPCDWRWLEQDERSPWYPGMRIFRQGEQGNWDPVLRQVASALQDRTGAPAPGPVAGMQNTPGMGIEMPAPAAGAAGSAGLARVAETRHGIVQYVPDQAIVGESIRYYGELRQLQLDVLAGMVPRGGTALEVGAGVGMHALFLAAALHASGQLLVLEPCPRMRRLLRQNLQANRVTNATLLRSAASGELGAIDELRLQRLDLLKIDGGIDAAAAVAGARDTLWQLRPAVFAAVRDAEAELEVAGLLRDCGYRCWRSRTALFNPQNFANRADDVFAGGCALAVLGVPEEIDGTMAPAGCIEI